MQNTKKTNPLVAICLSTYNGEKYLEQQLESIFQQTYTNIKIYVRDDDSSDNTKKILQKYANQLTIIARRKYGSNQKFYATTSLCKRGRLLCFLRSR